MPHIGHHSWFTLPSGERIHLLVLCVLTLCLKHNQDISDSRMFFRRVTAQKKKKNPERNTYHQCLLRLHNVPTPIPLVDIAGKEKNKKWLWRGQVRGQYKKNKNKKNIYITFILQGHTKLISKYKYTVNTMIMLQNISISNKCCFPFIKENKITFSQNINDLIWIDFNIDNNNNNNPWAPNQHIRIISEGSCDTEDWSNDCCKFSFASQK